MKVTLFIICLIQMITHSLGQSQDRTRLVTYYDQWHPDASVELIGTKGVTHVLLAFMLSHHLNNETFDPLWDRTEPGHQWHVETMKTIKRAFPDVKVGLAIGGWNDDPEIGWRKTIQDDASVSRFVRNLHRVIFGEFPVFENHQFDGVDIDWEYPGGSGVDYKSNPKSTDELHSEIDGYIRILQAIKADFAGHDKHLSIAVPGKTIDMVAFQDAPKAQAIFEAVDFVNLMTYDLANRRDGTTAHHSSVAGAMETVEAYLLSGLPAQKANLGFAFYAKWFHVNGACSAPGGIGCATFPLEDALGADSFQSGAMTFERKNVLDVPPTLSMAQNGRCGPDMAARCGDGYCCSADGWCGDSPQHCGYGRCNPSYSSPNVCAGPDLWSSWKAALARPADDSVAGGYTYLDHDNSIFWTWDPVTYATLKIRQIVEEKCLGGVMIWSFGEENVDAPDHLSALSSGVYQMNFVGCKGASPPPPPAGNGTFSDVTSVMSNNYQYTPTNAWSTSVARSTVTITVTVTVTVTPVPIETP